MANKKGYMNLNTLKKFSISCHYNYGDDFHHSQERSAYGKIQLHYKDIKSKRQNHDLTVSYNQYYENIPEKYYLKGTKERGLYFFWIKAFNKFYSLYIGSGILSTRIKSGYKKYSSISNYDIKNLYVSFFKTDDLSTKEMKDLEKKYITKMFPIMNKVHGTPANLIYIENLKAYGKLIKEKNASEVWADYF